MAGFLGRLLLCESPMLYFTRKSGYIVLLPEVIHLKHDNDNSLLEYNDLPVFEGLSQEKCIAAIAVHTMEYETTLKTIESHIKDAETFDLFKDVIDPLEKHGVALDTTWGLMKTFYLAKSNLMSEKCYMAIHERSKRVRSQKFISLPIYNACKAFNAKIDSEHERIVKKFILEGKLNGLELSLSERAQLNNILFKINQAKSSYRSKLRISTKLFNQRISDPNMMRDFPEDYLKLIAADSTQPSRGPWTITLQPHIMNQFLEYCPDSKYRLNVWLASVKRCSMTGEKSLENSSHVEELRSLRRKQANLLGFDTFADMSMETKMAGSVTNVNAVLSELSSKAFPAQKSELESLEAFAIDRGFDGPMCIWDVPYWQRKQLKTEFSLDESTLQNYFPFPKVLRGFFSLCEKLFHIHFVEEKEIDKWHSDVQFYNIFENGKTEPIAGFYLDPYIRPGEKIQTHNLSCWMISIRNRSEIEKKRPLASLVFNFQQPLYGKPSLLTFSDVKLFFHKFGHALQHLLTNVCYSEVSGLSNVEWDAVEVCSNFMVHWLHTQKILESISGHYETDEPLPKQLLEKIGTVSHHMAGYKLCRELYLSALDLELHKSKDYWLEVVRRLWPEYFLFPLDKLDAHPCSFSAIFSEEWAAAYFCHMWSRMIAADVFNAFEEIGLDNEDELSVVGKRFRSTFLAYGGAYHPSEVFRRFRGRDPTPNALLKSLGLEHTNIGVLSSGNV